MKYTFQILFLIFFITTFSQSDPKETITFKAYDGVTITADLYFVHKKTAPFILLFHQSGWSRGEYLEIAPKLNRMGFNCMAVDLRHGGEINNVKNMTKTSADKMHKKDTNIAPLPDIQKAVDFVRENYSEGNLILWGSSFSAGLVLKYAGDNPEHIDGVITFSPGEYYSARASNTFVRESAKNITCPVFITSAKDEKKDWWQIYSVIPSKNKFWFLPVTSGNHGSKALWEKFEDNKAYWHALTTFLVKYFD